MYPMSLIRSRIFSSPPDSFLISSPSFLLPSYPICNQALNFCFCSYYCCFSIDKFACCRISCKWNYRECSVLYLASFFKLCLSVIHSCSLLNSVSYDMIDHDLLLHRPVCLGHFKFLPIVNTAVMNICTCLFVDVFWDPWVEQPGQRVDPHLALKKLSDCFPKCFVPSCVPTSSG